MFHPKYRRPFALAIASLMVLTVTLWTSAPGSEQPARWGSATHHLRRALTTSIFPSSWTGTADQGAGSSTHSIDEKEEEGGEGDEDEEEKNEVDEEQVDEEEVDEEMGGESERAVGDDDLVAPFLRAEPVTGEDGDDASVDVVVMGVDESRELQSTCGGQCKGDYQCDGACFQCMYYDVNLNGVCCEPGGGGCNGNNRFVGGCNSDCTRDTDCNVAPCFSCIGGVCLQGGNRALCGQPCGGGLGCPGGCVCDGIRCVPSGNRNVCGQPCGGGRRCPGGCVCNGVRCVPSGNRNVCGRRCNNFNSFGGVCTFPCNYCSGNGVCIERNNNNFRGRCGDFCRDNRDCNNPNNNCNLCRNVGGRGFQCVNNGGGNRGVCGSICFRDAECNVNCNFCDFTLGPAGEGRCAGNRVVNPILRDCGETCYDDSQCGLNGCNFCIFSLGSAGGGICGGNRFGTVNNLRCGGTCIDSSMCPAGCSCIFRNCQ